MLIARYFDQRRGEAAQQKSAQLHPDIALSSGTVAARLDGWLPHRPPIEALIARGILRDPYEKQLICDRLERFLRQKVAERDLAHITGTAEYDPSVAAYLMDNGLTQLAHLNAEGRIATHLSDVEKQLRAARDDDERLRAAIPSHVKERREEASRLIEQATAIQDSTERVGKQLCDQLYSTEDGTDGLPSVEQMKRMIEESRVALRKQQVIQRQAHFVAALEQMVKMTDQARQLVFHRTDEAVRLTHEALRVCGKLPPNSREVGTQRVLFVLQYAKNHYLQAIHRQIDSPRVKWGTITLLHQPDAGEGHVPLPSPSQSGGPHLDGDESVKAAILESVAALVWVQKIAAAATQLLERGVGADESSVHVEPAEWWCFKALAVKPIAAFRYHFMSSTSPLCRVDRPEWAFNFMLDLCTQHAAALDTIWPPPTAQEQRQQQQQQEGQHQDASSELTAASLSALPALDVSECLGHQLADEVRLLVRAHMRLIVFQKPAPAQTESGPQQTDFRGLLDKTQQQGPEEAPEATSTLPQAARAHVSPASSALFLHLMTHLLELFRRWERVNVTSAFVLFRDFNDNFHLTASSQDTADAPTQQPPHTHKQQRHQQQQQQQEGAAERPLADMLSDLKANLGQTDAPVGDDDDEANAAGGEGWDVDLDLQGEYEQGETLTEQQGHTEGEKEKAKGKDRGDGDGVGMLDYWMYHDQQFVMAKLDEVLRATAVPQQAWQPQTLYLASRADEHATSSSPPAAAEGLTAPPIYRVVRVLVDLLRVSSERLVGLTSDAALFNFTSIHKAAIGRVCEALKERWNAMADPLKDVDECGLLLESVGTLEEFLTTDFRYRDYILQCVREVGELGVRVMAKFLDLVKTKVRSGGVRRMTREMGVFEDDILPILTVLHRRLSAVTFREVMKGMAVAVDALVIETYKDRLPYLTSPDALELIIANTRSLMAAFQSYGAVPERHLPHTTDLLPLLTLPSSECQVLLLSLTQHLDAVNQIEEEDETATLYDTTARLLPIDPLLLGGGVAERVMMIGGGLAGRRGNRGIADRAAVQEGEKTLRQTLADLGVSRLSLSEVFQVLDKRKSVEVTDTAASAQLP